MIYVESSFFTQERWLISSLGRYFLSEEQQLVKQMLENIFGEIFIQIGSWGRSSGFLQNARTQHAAVLDWRFDSATTLICNTKTIPIQSGSVDVVFLPHTLELVPSPHALLREVDRIVRPDGHIIILGFKRISFWGLRHFFSAEGYPIRNQRLISESRLRDWLKLLSFETHKKEYYGCTFPIEKYSRVNFLSKKALLMQWVPFLNGGFVIHAQKQVFPMTSIRQKLTTKHLRVVGGLAEPTNRVLSDTRYKLDAAK